MSDEIKSPELFLINDLETLRVVADPLRNQVLEVLIEHPHTVREVAEKLGLSPSRLYYHVNLMEKHNLITVVETRQVGNMIEKIYQATASQFEVESALLNFASEAGKESITTMVISTMDTTRDDMLRSLQARSYELEHGGQEHPRRAVINRVLSNLTPDRAEALQNKLCALVQEFCDADQDGVSADAQTYALTLAFYPTFYYPEQS